MSKDKTQSQTPTPSAFKGGELDVADPISASALYQGGNYFVADDFNGGPVTLTIAAVEVSDAFDKTALVLDFKDEAKKLRLNKTNAGTLIKRAGDDYTKWVGKQVMIAAVPVTYRGKTVGGIRIL